MNLAISNLSVAGQHKTSVLCTEIYSNICFCSYFLYGKLYYLYYLTEDKKPRGHQQYGPRQQRQRRHKLATRFDSGMCRFHTITYF